MTRAAGQSLETPPAESEIRAAATERVRAVYDSMARDQFETALDALGYIVKRKERT